MIGSKDDQKPEQVVQNTRAKIRQNKQIRQQKKSQKQLNNRVNQVAEAYMLGKNKSGKKASLNTPNFEIQTQRFNNEHEKKRKKNRNTAVELRYDEAYNEVEFLLLDENQKSQSHLLKPKHFKERDESNLEPLQLEMLTKDTTKEDVQIMNKKFVYEDPNIIEEQLKKIKDLLAGTIANIWIFIMPANELKYKDRIIQMYKGLITDDYIVPWCTSVEEVSAFLEIQNSQFKMVICLSYLDKTSSFKNNANVSEIYIYNNKGQKGLVQALQYKRKNKKVKNILVNLQKLVDVAQDEVQDEVQIYRCNQGFQKLGKRFKFPSFLKLTGKDKSEATQYRRNLYGAIKLQEDQKKESYQLFLKLVYSKYDRNGGQVDNIDDYEKINHHTCIRKLQQAKLIIQFYVRESFYYQIVNSMLRTIKSNDQFKHCALPFNETYHSIKMYYQYEISKEHKIPAMTLYRGSRLRKRDFLSLKKGSFIQMFGFMSTSKSLERAQSFTDKDGYLFMIHVKARNMPDKISQYDHGFVDINKYKLAANSFEIQEEVLFNALNIYRVGEIEPLNDYTLIHLEYGVMFDLMRKKYNDLTVDEKDVLINYQYCTELQHKIQDQGDLYLLSNELDKAEAYYKKKIREKDDAESHMKLANIYQEKGQIKAAEEESKKSLQKLQNLKDINDRQTCLKVFSIHSKNAQISVENEDYLNADEDLSNAIELLSDDDLFEKGKKIRERGEIKFKKGEIIEAQKDFAESQRVLGSLNHQANQKLSQIDTDYYVSILTLCCSGMTIEEIQRNRYNRKEEIHELQNKIDSINDNISDELNKVNKSLKDVAEYVNDKEKYEKSVKKARAYLAKVKERQTNDPMVKAKYKVIEATVQNYLELAQTEKLLNDAIKLVQSGDPYDMNVAQYSTILAKLQKEELDKMKGQEKVTEKPCQPISYDQTECKRIHQKSMNNYKKALNVLLYNDKKPDNPQILNLKNQMGELEYNGNNFTNCEEIIKEMKQSCPEVYNSQMAKSSLVLSKVAMARGELRYAFEVNEESDSILRKAIIKQPNNIQYEKVYKNSDIYLAIRLTRSQIYQKQMKHDLALVELKQLEGNILHKMDGYESHILLSTVYEELAQLHFNKFEIPEFQKHFKVAIEIRQKQMGKYNLHNITSFCNYVKFLIIQGDLERAQHYLSQAAQIFSYYSSEHPIAWIIYFIQALFSEKKNRIQESDELFRKAITHSKQNFDPSQVFLKKIRLLRAKKLLNRGEKQSLQESMKIFEELDQELDQGLEISKSHTQVDSEIDDEKITIKRFIYEKIEELHEKHPQKLVESNNSESIFKTKSDKFRQTYKIESKKTSRN